MLVGTDPIIEVRPQGAHAAVDVVADSAGEITPPSAGSVAATPPMGKP